MKAIVMILLAVFLCFPAHAKDEAFCEDPRMWAHFEKLLEAHPGDISIQIIHALRIGFCAKIEQNSIDRAFAIQVYNDMVDAAINEKEEEEAEEEEAEKRDL